MHRFLHMPKLSRLLLLAVLFQAFLAAGALAAVDPDNNTHRAQICSVSGLKWVQVAAGFTSQSDAPAPHHQGHCALCGCLAADLPNTQPTLLRADLLPEHPVCFGVATLLKTNHSAPPPARAPPVFS